MLLSLARRARGNPLILACLLVSFIAFYKSIHKFHLSTISRVSYPYFNHTKELLLLQSPEPIPIPRPQNEVPLSCPEPTCPPQLQCPPYIPSQLNTTITKASACPDNFSPASTSPPASSQFPGKPTKEQETIAKLRNEGIVIIFKTGAQEVSQLSIHLGTTLRWLLPSDILFFSDLQGSLGPFLIHDALRNVYETLRDSNPDFEIYRKIHEYQSTGQDILELKEDRSRGDDRGGWKLDKYKFIHMVEETFEMRPDAKWYVFIETDSYIVWPNLVAWLSKLDSKRPLYMGSAVWTGAHSFAHGGSGYILSNAAMNKLLGPDQPQGLARSWDTRMTSHCCGDIALGIALEEKGVKLTGARPFLNGYKPATFTYGEHWCQPAVAMHHLTVQEVSAMWRFERKREVMGIENVATFSELYEQFVEPHLMEERDNWDNLSHGQEFKEPDGWSLSSEEEELKREEEQRIREEREKLLAEIMGQKNFEEGEKGNSGEEEKTSEEERTGEEKERTREEQLKQLIEEMEKQKLEEGDKIKDNKEGEMNGVEKANEKVKPSEEDERSDEERLKQLIEDIQKERLEQEEEGKSSKVQKEGKEEKGSEEQQSKEKEKAKEREMILKGKWKGKKKQKGQEDSKPEAGVGDEAEKPLIDTDSGDGSKEEKDRNDSNEADDAGKAGKEEDPNDEGDGTQYNANDGPEDDAGETGGTKVQDGIEDTEETNDTESENGTVDSKMEKESSDSYAPPESDPQQTPEAELEALLSTIKAESSSPKRLLKRQDSLADADPELNTHPKWRPFSPEREAFKSFANCRRACAADNECFQFVHYERTCKLSTSFRLGAYKAPEIDLGDDGQVTRNVTFKSGWMMERIRKWTEKNACKEVEWPVLEF